MYPLTRIHIHTMQPHNLPNKIRIFCVCAFLLLTCSVQMATGQEKFILKDTSKGDEILGLYMRDNNNGAIEVFKKSDNTYHGHIVWIREPRPDVMNENRKLRKRPLLGIRFMRDFVYYHGQWEEGTVYSFEEGDDYHGKMWLEEKKQTLKMRGFIGLSIFGKTATFHRINKHQLDSVAREAGEMIPLSDFQMEH